MDLVNSYNIELSKERQNSINNNSNNYNYNDNKSNKLDLSDLLDDENLVNFMQNLDYDKYLKNQETREALFLLKNKIEKEKQKEKDENLTEENHSQNNDNNNQGENFSQKNEEENEINLPVIDSKNNLPIYHEKEWDGKNLNEDPEIFKKKIADRILKMDKVNFFYYFYYIFIFYFYFFLLF